MDQRDQNIIDTVRSRALLADRERRVLLAQRRELDATISALTEVTALSRGEIEKISLDVKRDVYRERSDHGRKPTLLGFVAAVVISWGVLSLTPGAMAPDTPAPATGVAGAPEARESPRRPSVAAKRQTPVETVESQLISGLTPDAEVHVYGVYEGTQTPEEAARVRGQKDMAVRIAQSYSSMSDPMAKSIRRRWGTVEAPPGQVTVNLPAAAHPIILVLTAYESVDWKIVPAPGTVIEHVIISGYEEQFVSGLPDDVPMTAYSTLTGNRLRLHCYSKQNACFPRLEKEIQRFTGKPIHQFRGAYQGDIFRSDYRAGPPAPSTPVSSSPAVIDEPPVDGAVPDPPPASRDDAPPAPPASTIHKWVDDSGRVYYGDRPPGAN